MKSKKAQGLSLGSLPNIFMTFAVIAIFAVVTLEIITETEDEYTDGSDEQLALSNLTEGVSNMTEKTPLLGTIIILAVIIAVVVGALAFAMK